MLTASASAVATQSLNGSFDADGAIGGLTFGVQQQTGQFVLGIEADVSRSNFNGSVARRGVSGGANGTSTDTIEADWFGSLRMRAGYVMGPVLLYATGGAAFTDATVDRSLTWSFADACPGSVGARTCHSGSGDLKAGFVVGGGFEYALSNQWSVKSEYLYTDYGSVSFSTANVGAPQQVFNHKFDLTTQTARVGINYRF